MNSEISRPIQVTSHNFDILKHNEIKSWNNIIQGPALAWLHGFVKIGADENQAV